MSHCPPRRILVAVDFGEASAAAVGWAGRLASRFGSTLLAVHAETVDVPPYFTREQFARIEGELRAARNVAESTLRRFVGAHTTVAATLRIVDRPPVEAVLDAAADVDLIVIGTHGRRGPKRWWLGSVAERVVREAAVPVLVVHAAGHAPSSDPGEVLLLADTLAPEVRAWAEAIAGAVGGPVRDGPPVERCETAATNANSVIAVPLEATRSGRTIHGNMAALARTCASPVLFVPLD